VKTPTSESYQDFLVFRLKDPNYAAVYLKTHLEESSAEPELLQLALSNTLNTLSPIVMNTEEAELHRQKLNEFLAQPGSHAIHHLAIWLDALGLKLTIVTRV
jgi:DNA-binding phage protein